MELIPQSLKVTTNQILNSKAKDAKSEFYATPLVIAIIHLAIDLAKYFRYDLLKTCILYIERSTIIFKNKRVQRMTRRDI